MTETGRSGTPRYVHFDLTVRLDGRTQEQVWEAIEDALCADHRIGQPSPTCPIEGMSSVSGTINEVHPEDADDDRSQS